MNSALMQFPQVTGIYPTGKSPEAGGYIYANAKADNAAAFYVDTPTLDLTGDQWNGGHAPSIVIGSTTYYLVGAYHTHARIVGDQNGIQDSGGYLSSDDEAVANKPDVNVPIFVTYKVTGSDGSTQNMSFEYVPHSAPSNTPSLGPTAGSGC
jgi:hypothetical protein